MRIVVLTGAGMSAESGLSTFRDSDGLWNNYNVEDVATPEGWARDPKLVTDFYNARRRELLAASPCEGHRLGTELERKGHQVDVITQNIDNLHEQAGSTHVLHLHGELMKVTSSLAPNDPSQISTLPAGHPDVHIGDLAPDGSQLRPFIVWFGEPVPQIAPAIELCRQAQVMIVIGTSLNVYPAAGLTRYVPRTAPIYLIDPKPVGWNANRPFEQLKMGASEGMACILKKY